MSSTPPASAPWRPREVVFAALFFLAYTVLATWPQAAHMSDAMADTLDAKLSAWIFHWDYLQTLRDPLNLFQAPILYPAKYVLAFSENMYGAAVFGFPLLAAGVSLVTNYNFLLLLGMFLSAISAWALARYVTGDALASVAAGIVYAFLPYKLSQLPHVHMEWGAFLCLVFLFLLRYLDFGRRRDAILLAVAVAWNFLACIQYAFFTNFLVAIVLGMELLTGGPSRKRRILGALLAMALGALACVPFAVPYRKASQLYGMRRTVGEMTYFSARPSYFLSAGERNRFWGPVTARFRGPEGDFFPGILALGLAGYAVLRSRREPGSPAATGEPPGARRGRAARAFDFVIVLLIAVWIAAMTVRGLRIGPVSVGDAGRVQVLLTLAVLVRLALAFPARSRYASLGDFVRRGPRNHRVLLLIVVAAVGIVVSLGGHTPYYRFLFGSLGDLFRAIRVAARGVVLFQVALAVLAAWGLSLWMRRRTAGFRIGAVAAAVALLTLEYRAVPLRLESYDSSPVAVYEWLRDAELAGALVELPLGFPYDCEYTFRQAEHGQALVNGHSSFAPKPYEELYPLTHQHPIPDVVWDKLERLGARLVILHLHAAGPEGRQLVETVRFVQRGLLEGRVQVLGAFPHGGDVDVVLSPSGAADRLPPLPGDSAPKALQQLREANARIAPPFAHLEVPVEAQRVPPGFWCYGWALDDSGIESIRVTADGGGGETVATTGGRWPRLNEVYPGYDEPGNGGYGFPVPELTPGRHTLRVRFVARDGGETVLDRVIVVDPALSPTPRGPGS